MRISPVQTAWIVLSLIGLVAGCPRAASTGNTTPDDTNPVPDADQTTYQRALDKAKNPTPADIHDQLTPITQKNDQLIWKQIDGHDHVQVGSWVSTFEYYQDSLGQSYNTGPYDIWVTAAPELQALCRDPAWRGDDVDQRLMRFLGLPPTTKKVGFAIFWVRPDDLFRPCPDNEITDSACSLALPDDVAPWYRAWFNDLRARQYQVSQVPQSSGWPWTQLGYTFDWHNIERPIGISEFVIKQNATVHIEALTPTAVYCQLQ